MAKLSRDDLMAALKNAQAKQAEQPKALNDLALKSPPVEKPVSLERLAIAIGKAYENRLKTKGTSR